MEKIVNEKKIKNSEEWKRVYLSLYLTKTNYRKKRSPEHAVCKNGECKIHVDDYHPHQNPIKHLRDDVQFSFYLFIVLILVLLKKLF